MVDLQRLVAELHGVARVQPALRLEDLGVAKAEAARLLRQLLDPETLFLVRPLDRDPEFARERGGARAMVHMAVREEDLLQRHAVLLDRGMDAVKVAAGIGHRGAAGGLVDQQRAVLLERRHGNQ